MEVGERGKETKREEAGERVKGWGERRGGKGRDLRAFWSGKGTG